MDGMVEGTGGGGGISLSELGNAPGRGISTTGVYVLVHT